MNTSVVYPSPHIYVGDEEFETKSGAHVVPVYRSSDATLTLVAPRIAAMLCRPLIGVDELREPDLRALLDADLLCMDPEQSRQRHYLRITKATQLASKRTFVLLPTSYCNMGCEYCGQEHIKGGLSAEHRSMVMNRIRRAMQSGKLASVNIRWFGGEPLMAFATIKQMSKELIRAADSADVAYHSNIVTNGALLDARKLHALVHDCSISTLHITIDGPAEIHDQHRPLKSGAGTFERLVTFLSSAVAAREYQDTEFVLRTNVDVRNWEHVSEYLRTMAKRGFANRKNVLFSLIAVHPWSNDVSAIEISKREYAIQESRWLNEMEELGLNYQLIPSAVRPVACGAITRAAEVVSSTGQVFSCTEQPLVPFHEQNSGLIRITDLGSTELRPTGEFDDWDQSVATHSVPCGTCWMLPVCGGHCPKAWREGDIPCPSMKLNMSARLAIVCKRRGLRPLGYFAGK